MFGSRYSKALTIGLIVLVVIVIGVVSYFVIHAAIVAADKESARQAAEQFENSVGSSLTRINGKNNKNNIEDTNEVSDTDIVLDTGSDLITGGSPTSNSSNSVRTYQGYPMSGTIKIPKIDLNLPVLTDSSAAAIDVSVAIHSGPGLNQVGNTVIIGHNYRDGRFFSNLKNLSKGDTVSITDNSGKTIVYVIYNIYTTAPEDSDFMERDTQGAREITLDTCTDDTQSRLIIWAKEK